MPGQNDLDTLATLTIASVSDTLYILRCEGREALSQLFEFHLVLACESDTLDPEALVGKTACLTIETGESERYLHGLIAAFQHQERRDGLTVYQALVMPRVYRLLHRRDCRIFQDKTTAQIVGDVLKGAGLASSDYSIQTKGAARQRAYCVQYRESDWAFVTRLLEEDGCFYAFEHTTSNHKLAIGDSFELHPPIPGTSTLDYVAPGALAPGKEFVFGFSAGATCSAGTLTLSDYNPDKPSVSLKRQKRGSKDMDLEDYDYPGGFLTAAEGDQVCGLRLEQASSGRWQVEGTSCVPRLAAGSYFVLSGHEHTAYNSKKLLLTSVEHLIEKGSDDEGVALDTHVRYSNTFRAILREVPFRPALVSARPRIAGIQTAVVVGPSQQEIYTDEQGRVQVHFHWDRVGQKNGKDSCWVRVAQTWAGPGMGALWIPRVGDEVVVEFLEGNPDRPLIVGSVYNGQNKPPVTLPDNATQSTWKTRSSTGGKGFNELRFEDKAGQEEIYIHAQKVLRIETAGGHEVLVDDGQKCITLTTTSGHTLTFDDEGKAVTAKSAAGHTIGLDDTGKKLTIKSTGGHTVALDDTQKKLTVKSTGGHTVTLDDTSLKVSIASMGDLELKANMNIKMQAGVNVDISGSGLVNIKGSLINLN